jgi:hypothetical protein
VLFGFAYLIVRLIQQQRFAIAGKRDPNLLEAVRMVPCRQQSGSRVPAERR